MAPAGRAQTYRISKVLISFTSVIRMLTKQECQESSDMVALAHGVFLRVAGTAPIATKTI